ncbi:MAG TPA: S8 family peptidase, partial [Pyrinomonadaceae bacterium]
MQPRRHVPLSRLTSLLVSCALLASTAAPRGGATSGESGVRTAVSLSSARSAARRRGAAYRAGQFIVRFREDVAESERAALAASEGASRRALRGGSGVELWSLTQGKDVEATVAALSSRPAIEYAEPNYLITADQFTPSDTRFPEQWALRNAGQAGGEAGSDIGVIRAWAKTTGSPRTVVAVIDGGVDFSHPDLANNRWTNPADPANGQDDGGDGFVDDLSGWDWVSNSGVVTDPAGHGTAVAGLIAAEGDNGVGTAGVMWSASVMSLRVLDERGAGDVASAIEAIDYASARGAHVVNCSWGTDAESRALSEAVARAGRRGSLVVASAGNDSRDIDAAPRYPAAFDLPNVVAAAATNNFDQLTPWSNWGAGRAHVAAPGTDLLTTAPSGGYRVVSGTSA